MRPAGSDRSTPSTVTLPITDLSVYPTLGGPAAEGGNQGYGIQLLPGIEGQPIDASTLMRFPGSAGSPESVEVHASTSSLTFEWITAEVTFALDDQAGVPIAGSQVLIYASGALGIRPLPLTTTLPITDPIAYPDVRGSESARRGFRVGGLY